MFRFKGISSSEMSVIIAEEESFKAKASQRYETIEVEGRDGAEFIPLGYSYVERPIYVQCLDISKIDDILAWLDGEGDFEYQGRKTKASFFSKLEPQRKAGIRIIDATFIRQPFWYKVNDDYVDVTNSVINEGNIKSRPIIKLEKTTSDSVDITINGLRFVYNFTDSYVIIDCKEKTAEYEGLNRSRQLEIGYDFPALKTGENAITINSGACNIKIKRKDCWL